MVLVEVSVEKQVKTNRGIPKAKIITPANEVQLELLFSRTVNKKQANLNTEKINILILRT